MSLDETARAVWELRAHPLAALIANRGATALFRRLPEAVRAPFTEAERALGEWYPAGAVPLREIHDTLVAACKDAHAQMGDAAAKEPAVRVLLRGLYVQLVSLDRQARPKRTLPSECYDIDEVAFAAHVGELAGLERHLERRQMEKRLAVLLPLASVRGAKWQDIVDAAARQGWGRLGAPLAKLTPRVREIAEAIDLGAAVERADVGPRGAVHVALVDGSRRVAMLDEAERAALFAAVPWAEPARA